MSLRQLPNLICVARIALVVPVAIFLYQGQYALALLLFGVAAFSDGLDGFLAKRFGWTTELGKVLDPLADKLLLVTMFIMLAITDRTPMWLMLTVVGRDVLISVGSLAFIYFFGPLNGKPTNVSKVNTLLQLLYVLALIASLGFGWPPGSVTLALGAAAFVTTVVSGVDYTATYIRRASEVSRLRRAV